MASERVGALLTSEPNKREEVQQRVNDYEGLYEHGSEADRKANYMSQVNAYYDLATPFYEYAWGQSFHFAPQANGECYEAAIARYEHTMALRLEAKKGMRILDVGCGVGGPARAIARISGANIVGVNNSKYQIERATKLTADAGLSDLVSFIQSDFHDIASKFPAESFDAIFSIEAIVHSPKKLELYKVLYGLLKPGGRFITGEWVLTDKHDPNNSAHNEWKHKIEKGNGLPPLELDKTVLGYFKDAGFEVIESKDHAFDSHPSFPWYHPLDFSFTPQGVLKTRFGQYFTHAMVKFMEWVRLAAPGTTDISRILMEAAEGLVGSGKAGTFTPMYIILGRKPM